MKKLKCRCTIDGDRCGTQTVAESQVCRNCSDCKPRKLARKGS